MTVNNESLAEGAGMKTVAGEGEGAAGEAASIDKGLKDGVPAVPAGDSGHAGEGGKAKDAGADDHDVLPQKPEPEKAGKDKVGKDGAEGGEKPGEEDALKIDLPEGYKADEKSIAAFKEVMKQAGIKSADAQKIADIVAGHDKERDAVFSESVDKTNREWLKEIHSDPEFGGAKFEENANYYQKALRRFMPGDEYDKWTGMIKITGMRNCPPLFRMLSRVGRHISEAGPVEDDAAAPRGEMSDAEILWGHLDKKK